MIVFGKARRPVGGFITFPIAVFNPGDHVTAHITGEGDGGVETSLDPPQSLPFHVDGDLDLDLGAVDNAGLFPVSFALNDQSAGTVLLFNSADDGTLQLAQLDVTGQMLSAPDVSQTTWQAFYDNLTQDRLEAAFVATLEGWIVANAVGGAAVAAGCILLWEDPEQALSCVLTVFAKTADFIATFITTIATSEESDGSLSTGDADTIRTWAANLDAAAQLPVLVTQEWFEQAATVIATTVNRVAESDQAKLSVGWLTDEVGKFRVVLEILKK
jgi:hypothetical protein